MNKKYQIIYADPPWALTPMSKIAWKIDSPLTNKYPTMTLNQLKALPIKSLCDTNCGLFLWCTHSTLPEALDLMHHWGFKYHCTITWDKGGGFSLWGFHRRTEFLLYGYTGHINVNQKGKYIPTLITEPKGGHSSKPMLAYKWLESNTPTPRLELFARSKRDGWDCWGNEVESDIEIDIATRCTM